MSGRTTVRKELDLTGEFEVEIDFIEPEYFKDDAVVGRRFTLREASRILGDGVVTEVN